jgi:hypothetical protein
MVPYETHKGWLYSVYNIYLKWVDKWINTPVENSIIIEYNDFMSNPEKVLTELFTFLKNNKPLDSLISLVINDLNIEYKNTITVERYNELSNLIKKIL